MKNASKPKHVMITGGTRSGKSKFAEETAASLGGQVIYLATAEVYDQEMRERVTLHQQRRPSDWLTVEAPLELIPVLQKYQQGTTILLDCLTIYLSNLYFNLAQRVPETKIVSVIQENIDQLAQEISKSNANIVLVTNEVGWGIVPENRLARIFRDFAGLANQQMAQVCHEVYIVVSGIPVRIKGEVDVAKSKGGIRVFN